MSRSHGPRRKGGRQLQSSSDVMPCDPEIVSEVSELFTKIKSYTKPSSGEWSIPDPNDSLRCLPQENPCLQALKESLNAVKNQLSDKNLEIWHQHTNSTNRAGKVIGAVRSAANAEICTQAWCKFYEILGTFDLLPEEALQNGELNTVHLCEAPGAFITALNHYIKTSERTRYCDWSWAANTLNPYHEGNASNTTIADDRLIANTLPWWFFGSDNTGNIMSQKHLLELQTFVSNMHSVDLVTADGSFDCQENPDEQEALVASLQYCEATAALLLLNPGGSFVVKMFTLYEHSSICLIYLLNCCFRTVSVFKPATSKAGNSEVYVVCLHYDGKEAVRPLLSKMIRNYGPSLANREALFPNALLPPSFLEQHEQVCSYFHRLQVETINENLRLFEEMSVQQRQRLDIIRDYTAKEYLQRLQVSCLPRARWLSRNTVNPACCSVTGGRPLDQRKQLGTFNERKELLTLSWRERIQRGCLASWIQVHCTEDNWNNGCVLEGPLANCHVRSWYIIMGAGLTMVSNSPFCEGALLSHLNEALLQTSQSSKVVSTLMPPCCSCQVVCATSILTEVAGLCGLSASSPDYETVKRQCLIFGGESVWGVFGDQMGALVIKVSAEPSFPVTSRITLHDGDPQYQKELLGCVLHSMQNLHAGDALLLPVLSALTRVTAAIVLCLHLSFRTVTFICPPPVRVVGAVLACAGFCPEVAVQLLPWLTDLHDCMGRLAREDGADDKLSKCQRQVLQFVPMEELLRLTDFLCTMNSAIVRYKLHLLMQT